MQYLIYLIICSNLLIGALGVEMVEENFDKPIFVCSFPDNNQNILVLEQKGIIKLIKNGKLSKTPFLNIKDRVHFPLFPGDEMGLLGFAFDPNFILNGYFYLNYVDKDDNTIISRFNLKGLFADKNSEKIILKLKQPYSNHNGGHLAFGKDGYLYVALGDGGSKGDPENRAQNLNNLFGAILRIDINTDLNYLIPKDNPFYNKNVKKEIWAYGLRNPWRFSFDKLNDDMYIADVGQNLWEEINIVSSEISGGLNFGWNYLEGTHCYPSDSDCNTLGYTMPVFEYPNNANYAKTLFGINQPNMDGCSITGGYVYRGDNIPELYGRYIFGDYCTGKVWSMLLKEDLSVDVVDHTKEILKSMGKREFYLSSFGEDNNGEIFLVDYNGTIYKLIQYNQLTN